MKKVTLATVLLSLALSSAFAETITFSNPRIIVDGVKKDIAVKGSSLDGICLKLSEGISRNAGPIESYYETDLLSKSNVVIDERGEVIEAYHVDNAFTTRDGFAKTRVLRKITCY